jgi:heterodisulfide reductase subunit A
MDKCIACGECSKRCPKKVDSEYNEGLDKRKAVYVQYSQAVPLKYGIDSSECIYFLKGKCRACEKFCPTGAVNFEDKPKDITLNVGSVVLAPGFDAFDPTPFTAYQYYQHPNVVTAMEFERILAATGPSMGHLIRPGDQAEPRKIAFLQCVGSRDLNKCDNGYCSSVCCMYAIKEASIAKEHSHEPLDVSIFFMDMRTFGKDFEKYYTKAQDQGINFIRSRIHTVDPLPDGGLRLHYVTEDGQPTFEDFDMVVLSVGLEINQETKDLAQKLDVELDHYSFVKASTFTPVATSRPGIYACGVFTGPKDIPVSVMEASAAASAASRNLTPARGTEARTVETPAQRDVIGQAPRVGVFVCHCGINIAGVVRVAEVAEFARTLPFVEYVGENMFSCSQDTQDKMSEIIKENDLNRIVVAACTPRTHEPLFQETLVSAGLNKYLFEMANIRNQDSWVHSSEPEKATEKAKDLVRMAVAKAALLSPLSETTISVDPSALVIGGGVAGMNASLALSAQGFKVDVVEKTDTLGGHANRILHTSKGENVAEYLTSLAEQIEADENITVHMSTAVEDVDGFIGNFTTKLSDGSEVKHGAALIATGASEYKPTEYLYGKDKRVLTSLDMDDLLRADDPGLKKAKTFAFIQCVGSRNDERPYCSKVCCTHTVANALEIKKINPDAKVFVLYRDMRTYGGREDLYKAAREQGVIFIRHDLENLPQVAKAGKALELKTYDPILTRDVIINPDYLVLATAIISNHDEALAQMFKVPLDDDGWFLEAHQKLRPVDFATDGVFLTGLAHYPKPMDEAIAQAQAAASRAVTVLTSTEMTVGGVVAEINQARCTGCNVCVTVCPYQAIELDDNEKAVVNDALCKGCGTCVSSCRSGAPQLRGFTNAGIFAQIAACF